MTEESIAEVKIVIYPKNYKIVATTHKDGQSIEVGIEGVDFFPYLGVLHLEDVEIKLIQSSGETANET